MKSKCIECDGGVEVSDDALKGEIVTCSECGQDLEISSLDNGAISFVKAEVEGEDWGE
ncbi:MAG: lysine biosynthesis protein [Thaumarchaeota archaeon]|nr:lysine biosynthesis protein [Nitrososphaerota archaeon]